MSIHPIFGQVRVVLVEAASTGLLTGRAASQALATLARGEAWSLADEPAVTDALVRLAWLLFVRAPQLDGRYVVLSPMQIGALADGTRAPAEVVDELAKLEQVSGDGAADLDRVLSSHGKSLAALLVAELPSSLDRVMGERAAQFEDQTAAAVREGRWDDVPFDGPDHAAIRAAIRFRPRDQSIAVVEAWRAAEAALEDEQPETALTLLDGACQAAPDLFECWVRRARVRLLQNDRVGAGADVERAIQLNPAAAFPRAIRAELRTIIRDIPGALSDWDAAVKAAPQHGKFLLGRGYTRIAANRASEALADFREAARLAPQDPVPLFSLADALVRGQDMRGALAVYDELIARWPDDEQARLNRGTARLMQGDATGAVDDLTEVIQRRPLEALPWLRRAVANLRAQRVWAGWVDALTALALAPDDWAQEAQAEQVLAAAHRGLGGEQRANPVDVEARADELRRRATGRELLRLAERLGRHLPAEGVPWHLLRGLIFLDHGKWTEAMRAAEEGMAVDERDPQVALLLGRALVGAGKADEALSALDKAQGADLDAASTFELAFARARAFGLARRLPEAVGAFRAAAELRPDRADVWFYLAIHLDLVGDPTAAEAAYTSSVTQNPAFAPAWFNRACERSLLGRLDEALDDLRQAVRLDPKWAAEARNDAYLSAARAYPGFEAAIGG